MTKQQTKGHRWKLLNMGNPKHTTVYSLTIIIGIIRMQKEKIYRNCKPKTVEGLYIKKDMFAESLVFKTMLK